MTNNQVQEMDIFLLGLAVNAKAVWQDDFRTFVVFGSSEDNYIVVQMIM